MRGIYGGRIRDAHGVAVDVAEATALLAATGEDLDRLAAVAAARVRDAGLVAAGRQFSGRSVVTYSPKVCIPVIRLRRDRCITARSWRRPRAGAGGRRGRAMLIGRRSCRRTRS